jgi:hypothetical protein
VRGSKYASREKILNQRGCVFVSLSQPPVASKEIALHYDGSASGQRIYAYVGGNPLSRVDPTGQFFFLPIIAGIISGGGGAAATAATAAVVGTAVVGTAIAIQSSSGRPKPVEVSENVWNLINPSNAYCPTGSNPECKLYDANWQMNPTDVMVPERQNPSKPVLFGGVVTCFYRCPSGNHRLVTWPTLPGTTYTKAQAMAFCSPTIPDK